METELLGIEFSKKIKLNGIISSKLNWELEFHIGRVKIEVRYQYILQI